MLEHIEVYRIYYNHRCGTGSGLIAVRSIDELEQACNEFEKKFAELEYDIQDIAPSVEMTPTLFTKPTTKKLPYKSFNLAEHQNAMEIKNLISTDE